MELDMGFSGYEWRESRRANLEHLRLILQEYRSTGKRIVTTNGCFDLLHAGHSTFLTEARHLGDVLIVGLNSDRSVRQLKGPGRPINTEFERAMLLAALRVVSHVVVFDEIVPTQLLSFVRPHIHCKAGDYSIETLPEAHTVISNGGQVRILTYSPEHSTTRLIDRVMMSLDIPSEDPGLAVGQSDSQGMITKFLLDSSDVLRRMAYHLGPSIGRATDLIISTIRAGNKIMVCGNGGSAADSEHLVGELVGRFRIDRPPLPAIALTSNASVLTGVSNDFGFDQIFARQVAALGLPGDLLIVISTSGASPNILSAIDLAHNRGLKVLAFSSNRPSALRDAADELILVPSHDTAHTQQGYLVAIHVICSLVERAFVNPPGN